MQRTAAIRLATAQKMELRPEKALLPFLMRFVTLQNGRESKRWRKFSSRLCEPRGRLFISETIRNNVGVYRYLDEGIDRAVLKQQCEIPHAIFGTFAGGNGRERLGPLIFHGIVDRIYPY